MKQKPFKTDKEALGALLDLIGFRLNLDKNFKLSDEEQEVFCLALRIHDNG